MRKNTLMMLADINMSDEELQATIQKSLPVCKKNKQGFYLSVKGFDDDPREIWEIPEVLKFYRRLKNLGFLSILTTSSHIFPSSQDEPAGFGAFEIYLFATNQPVDNAGKKEFNVFLKFLREESNPKSRLLEQQQIKMDIDLNVKKIGSLEDGQTRFSGLKKKPKWLN